MKEHGKPKPPSLANWLASKFLNEALLEEFFGDLKEIYEDRIAIKGKFYAKLMYWVDVLHLLIGFTSFNLFKNQNNPSIMLQSYLKVAVRNFSRNKAYSLINIMSLAVGMGVCLLIFQYTYFELSYDKFHNNVQNTYRISTDITWNGAPDETLLRTTYALGVSAKEEIPEIKEYVTVHPQYGNVIVTNPDKNESFRALQFDIFYVDDTFLEVFNFPLKLGNKESVFDDLNNIVITEKTAHKYFGADNPIGKTLKLSGGISLADGDYRVTGVLADLPINSHLQFEILLPLQNYIKRKEEIARGRRVRDDGWERYNYVTYVSIDESANLDLVHEKLDQLIVKYRGERNAREGAVYKARLQPIADIHLKPKSSADQDYVANYGNIQDVQVFSIVAIFILCIAWVNYINLSTARSMNRAKEVGVRKSIGAFRKQLISQFMIESVLVNLIAALLAIGIAFLALPILSRIVGKELELGLLQIPMFWAWFLGIILLGSLLSGLYPAFVLSAFKPISMLGANKTARAGKVDLRRGLIVFQFLVSLLLISGTYLVYKQITFMKNQELGIDMEKILVFRAPIKLINKSTLQAFRTEVARHHSIAAVAASDRVPGKGQHWIRPTRKLKEPESVIQYGRFINGSLGLPETYDFEFLAGSSFTADMPDSEFVIINEEVVRTFGLGSPENAIQEKLKAQKVTYKVIGVVKNFHWHSLRETNTPYFFVLSVQSAGFGYFSVKMNLSNIPESLAHIEKIYKSFFPENPIDYFFLDDAFNSQYQADVQFGNLFLAFTALAIFIACIGLFALVSFSATLRVKEIGIRKVLGANISNIMILLSREYVILLLIATVLAIPAIIYWGGSWLDNYAFRTNLGIELFLIPGLIITFISLLTVGYRTYSAAKTNPVESLRKE